MNHKYAVSIQNYNYFSLRTSCLENIFMKPLYFLTRAYYLYDCPRLRLCACTMNVKKEKLNMWNLQMHQVNYMLVIYLKSSIGKTDLNSQIQFQKSCFYCAFQLMSNCNLVILSNNN